MASASGPPCSCSLPRWLGRPGCGCGQPGALDGQTAANDFGAHRPTTATPSIRAGLEDGLVVVNHGTAPLHLAVYAADAFTTDAGQLDFVGKDAKSTGVGAWVQPARDDVTVRPGESVEVPFAIAVPRNAAPGDYMGGIVTSPTGAGDADGIDVDRRAGIVRLRVGGELEPSLAVEGVHVRYSGTTNPLGKGDATVTYTIHNTGNAILTARQAVSVSGPFGRGRSMRGRSPTRPRCCRTTPGTCPCRCTAWLPRSG